MSSTPWYAWYPGDYANKARRLSFAEDAAYRRLLDEYYSMAEALPVALQELWRIANAQGDDERAAVTKVAGLFFFEKSGRLHNKRADIELSKQARIRDTLSQRGKAGAAARWQPPMLEPLQRPMLEQCEETMLNGCLADGISTSTSTSTSITTSREIERRDRSGKGGRKHAMPATFALSARVQSWAQSKGWGNLEAHLESFKLKCQANGYTYADWDSALMEAIRKDWAGLRINGHDKSSETLADLLAKE